MEELERIPVLQENGNLVKMDLRSANLHLQFDKSTIYDKTYMLLNAMADKYGFTKLDPEIDPIYDPEPRGTSKNVTFNRSVHMYLMAHILNTYRQMEILSDQVVSSIYPLYENGEIELFDQACIDFTRKLNQGKCTRKQKAKTYSLYKSLKLLQELDEEYNEYLVNKFMQSGEVSGMDGSGIIKF